MIVEVNNISKSYEQQVAISDISFSVVENELFGFIGPDGAGKTTIFRILATLLLPDSGEVNVLGYNVFTQFKQIRQYIGYMPGRFSLYADLSVEENLNFFATIYGTSIKENYHLIAHIYSHLEPFKDRMAAHLSGGMKQKLALCCALIHKPKILILDEPTTGVDAVSRQEFWDLLKTLKQNGITIIVSTPYMDEASRCDRVALIQNGRIMDIQTPESFIQNYKEPLYAAYYENPYQLKTDLLATNLCNQIYLFGKQVHFTLKANITKHQVEQAISQLGYKGVTIKEIKPAVEDCFIYFMSETRNQMV